MWATFFPQQLFFRGLGLVLYRKQTTRNLTHTKFSAKHPFFLVKLCALVRPGRSVASVIRLERCPCFWLCKLDSFFWVTQRTWWWWWWSEQSVLDVLLSFIREGPADVQRLGAAVLLVLFYVVKYVCPCTFSVCIGPVCLCPTDRPMRPVSTLLRDPPHACATRLSVYCMYPPRVFPDKNTRTILSRTKFSVSVCVRLCVCL